MKEESLLGGGSKNTTNPTKSWMEGRGSNDSRGRKCSTVSGPHFPRDRHRRFVREPPEQKPLSDKSSPSQRKHTRDTHTYTPDGFCKVSSEASGLCWADCDNVLRVSKEEWTVRIIRQEDTEA